MKQSIILLPNFNNQSEIEQLRQLYDPLYLKIPPHITLVFPFDCQLSLSQLTSHIKTKTTKISPFPLELAGITGDRESGYLFLTVKKGNDSIIQLHDQLYQEPLAPYLYRKTHFIPHITLGRVSDRQLFDQVIEETTEWNHTFKTIISEVYLEEIKEDDFSVIKRKISLD